MSNSTYDMLHNYLEERGCFQEGVPSIVEKTSKCIAVDAPRKMKYAIALSELCNFVSHLRKPIMFQGRTEVPVNMISFILAKSGVSKDSSMNLVRKGLEEAYSKIDGRRKADAIEVAKKSAILDGKTEDDWNRYYTKPRPLLAGLATQEGLLSHFDTLQKSSLGAGYIQSSEIGTELLTNGNMTDILKTISIAYDLGKIPAKIIKNDEAQTGEIDKLPISALLFGSEDAILYEQAVKNKFKTVFSTQLARRSLFNFNPELVREPEFSSIEELTTYRNNQIEEAKVAQDNLKDLANVLVSTTTSLPLQMSEEANNLFNIYKDYNFIKSERMSKLYPMSAISRRHRQWFALKLAGAYAILDGLSVITPETYIWAIRTCEMFSTDLAEFEAELIKEPYELFVQFMHYTAENGESELSIHKLRKMGYIPSTGGSDAKVKELVTLASSYDKDGIYTAVKDGIHYKRIIKTEEIALSYTHIDITGIESCNTKDEIDTFKQNIAKQSVEGFDEEIVGFSDLNNLLQNSLAYTPFKLKNGTRGKDNVVGGIKFLVLDVDNAGITDEEAHILLEGLNHFISRSFDPNNQFKFRILLELDAEVDVDDKVWKHFLIAVSEYLGIKVDILPKSQIFYSYTNGDRTILSELTGEPLETKPHIMLAESKNTAPSAKEIPKTQAKQMLNNPLDTFAYAFDAEDGEGSRSLIRCAYHARDLGASIDEIIELMYEINNYWAIPLSEDRLENTIIQQIRRW